MRYLILTFSLVFVFISSCKDKTESPTAMMDTETVVKPKPLKLNGTWELVGFYNYKDNRVVDSFKTNSESRQLKMYTDTKVMWCKYKPADSSEWFGYGTYKYEDNMLTEVLDFGSEVMDEVIAERKQFEFEIKTGPDQFQQIELDEDGNRIYSENYQRVE
ncbi:MULTISPECIES: hypothetical protein [Winogradskyella]|uniref:Lipocalin-like protein n=2 Tax=Winogradskyella TaxID=286104 RepID=A0A368ZL33_9FLAO|nr:hypothetical protein [Winogradskyella arenosi]RCW92325.1 hypothetical protein DFQ08_102349 [Winogradskyella arenosi]